MVSPAVPDLLLLWFIHDLLDDEDRRLTFLHSGMSEALDLPIFQLRNGCAWRGVSAQDSMCFDLGGMSDALLALAE